MSWAEINWTDIKTMLTSTKEKVEEIKAKELAELSRPIAPVVAAPQGNTTQPTEAEAKEKSPEKPKTYKDAKNTLDKIYIQAIIEWKSKKDMKSISDEFSKINNLDSGHLLKILK